MKKKIINSFLFYFFHLETTLVFRIDVHARLLILRGKKSPLHGLILVYTFIDFVRKKFPCTFIPSCTCVGIGPARLLIWGKNSPFRVFFFGLHVKCFLRIFPPARLFRPTRLFGTLEHLSSIPAVKHWSFSL